MSSVKIMSSVASLVAVPEMPLERFIEVANRFFRNTSKKYGFKITETNRDFIELAFTINNRERFKFRLREYIHNGIKLWIITLSDTSITIYGFKKYMTKLLKGLPGITLLWIEPEAISRIIERYGKGTALATSIYDPFVLSKRALRKIPHEIYEEIEYKEYNIPRTIEVRIKAPTQKVKEKLKDIKRIIQVEYVDVIFRFTSLNPGPAEVLLNEDAFIGVRTKAEHEEATKKLWYDIFRNIADHESKLIELFYRALPKYEKIEFLNTTLTAISEPGKPITIALKLPKDKPITKTDIIAYATALIYGASGLKGYFFYGKIIKKNDDNVVMTVFDALHGGNYHVSAFIDKIVITPSIGATIGGLLSLYRFTREHFNWYAEVSL